MDRRFRVIIIAVVIVASFLRLAGIFDDFWLDEIWSYYIAKLIAHPTDILTTAPARIDNNHPLNTFFLWAFGEQPNWFVYRIPALLAGIGSLIMVPIIMLRRGKTEAILATLLVGFSYPLIFFSSEARGYSLAIFFALLAFDAFERYSARQSWKGASVFAAACVLGLLSHLSFLHIYLGLLALTVYRLPRAELRQVAVWDALRLHGVPVVFLIGLYAVFVRGMTIGGAPPQPLWQGISDAVSSLIAMPGPVEIELILVAGAVLIFVGFLTSLRRRGSDLWVFLLVAVIISPAVAVVRQMLLLGQQYQPMAARYFVILLPFVLLAVGMVLPEESRRRKFTKISSILLLFAWLGVNLWQTMRFLQIGRGHYSDAAVYMAENTPGATLAVEVDHPLRTGMVLNFYSRLMPPGEQLVLIDVTQNPLPPSPPAPPRWLVMHSNLRQTPPAPTIRDPWGNLFVFDREFSYYGLSGYSWYVYRRSS